MKNSRAQIVATLGPASKKSDVIREMITHQMDVVRLNFSWGTYEEHANYIATVRAQAKELARHIPIIQDLSGPREKTKDDHQFGGADGSIITEKDENDLAFGVERAVDYIALSYVGSDADVLELKEKIKAQGAKIPVIAKIEREVAIKNIDGIIRAADAIMIARGDLGDAIPFEKVPFVQHTIIRKCKKAKKPVVVATEMLASMVMNPRPTRAEVTDVAHAILDGADAVMLSEETARGKYPIRSIDVMERIVKEAEKHFSDSELHPL